MAVIPLFISFSMPERLNSSFVTFLIFSPFTLWTPILVSFLLLPQRPCRQVRSPSALICFFANRVHQWPVPCKTYLPFQAFFLVSRTLEYGTYRLSRNAEKSEGLEYVCNTCIKLNVRHNLWEWKCDFYMKMMIVCMRNRSPDDQKLVYQKLQCQKIWESKHGRQLCETLKFHMEECSLNHGLLTQFEKRASCW